MILQFNRWTLAILVCIAAFTMPVQAQKTWEVSSIPAALLESANAVIRYEELTFEIESKSQAKIKRKLVVTVLNESGESDFSQVGVGYDKFTKINDFEGTLYDQTGKVIKKLKNSEINDYGYGATSDMITDARVKLATFGKKSYPYPYTIEFAYETREKNMMFYPSWRPIKDENIAVEHSAFTVKVPSQLKFRYKLVNQVTEPTVSQEKDGASLYSWRLTNQAALKFEDFSLMPEHLFPMVLTAPSAFEVQGYQGDFSSWNDLGKFYYALNANRDMLPEQVKNKVQELTKGITSDQEKIQVLYKWMQSTTRYVSIQLGIGGWQTIDAATVATKGYGDCKALTNYMIALLKEAKIPAYTALIKAGDSKEIVTDFPNSQFNHVIACIPQVKDTIWLECTSQTNPVNYLGSFTGDRYALLVMPEGGKLVQTNTYPATDNVRSRQTQVTLDTEGQGLLQVKTVYKGLQYEYPSQIAQTATTDDQRKWILNNLFISGVELTDFRIENKPFQQNGEVEVNLSMKVKQLASKTGTRLFLKPTFMTKEVTIRPTTSGRKQDFFLDPEIYDFTYVDEVQVTIPPSYQVESIPQNVAIESVFGTYTTEVLKEEGKLTYRYTLRMNGGRYKADQYTDWNDFLKKIRRAERAQIVFVH